MADVKQTVTKTDNRDVHDDGTLARKQTKKVHTESSEDKKTTAVNLVWFILGVVEVLLSFRFVLKLFGANPANGFVNFVYDVSGVLSAPFDSVFGVTTKQTGRIDSVFEPSILVAIIVYALVAWGVVKLIKINQRR